MSHGGDPDIDIVSLNASPATSGYGGPIDVNTGWVHADYSLLVDVDLTERPAAPVRFTRTSITVTGDGTYTIVIPSIGSHPRWVADRAEGTGSL